MIVYKEWREHMQVGDGQAWVQWDGWFLFGVIPLYLRRKLRP